MNGLVQGGHYVISHIQKWRSKFREAGPDLERQNTSARHRRRWVFGAKVLALPRRRLISSLPDSLGSGSVEGRQACLSPISFGHPYLQLSSHLYIVLLTHAGLLFLNVYHQSAHQEAPQR